MAEAARRARQHATVVASLAAVVPTVLAAQGMAALAMDVLGFSLVAAVALAGFLELGLISSALLARASALAGRPGGADAAAVWAVSAVSGLLAGAHEFVGPETGGVRSWESDPSSLLAAGVRVAAPLVAAWLWERVLTAARREHAERTLVEVRRDRRLRAGHRGRARARRDIGVCRASRGGAGRGWGGRDGGTPAHGGPGRGARDPGGRDRGPRRAGVVPAGDRRAGGGVEVDGVPHPAGHGAVARPGASRRCRGGCGTAVVLERDGERPAGHRPVGRSCVWDMTGYAAEAVHGRRLREVS